MMRRTETVEVFLVITNVYASRGEGEGHGMRERGGEI